MKWILFTFVSAVLTTASIAKDTALWDGTCRNVTHQLDGYLKLLIQQEGSQISGYISISGWLAGSAEIKGKRDGNTISFVSKDPAGVRIEWSGIVRDDILDGEYTVDPIVSAGLDKQVGEFKVELVDKHQDGIPESEAAFRKLFMLGLESELNAPVQLSDGTMEFGADSIFQAIHPVGTGVSVRVTEIDIDWKENATRKDAKDIRKYTIAYTLYWHGIITPIGWTKMSLTYNANLGQVTEHKIIQSTGTTNREAKDMAFGVGVLIGQAAMEAFLNSK
ncbi:hypothetical protein [Prosthecobacter sp.]|uniref:hypothetical protein n=1 Tax=Prosthecobacter sp. TaxID=1965333 RepID=UPI0037CA042D